MVEQGSDKAQAAGSSPAHPIPCRDTSNLTTQEVRFLSAVFLGGHMSGRLKAFLEHAEKEFILNALRERNGNVARTAVWLGISRSGLTAKLERWRSSD